ncbi:uncharacterized protein [Procambarus clarkii]|uniref:uncharacterized protein n=1 Tax=Procambarus clarkii TaxID=6728 RepID=UPI0037429E95
MQRVMVNQIRSSPSAVKSSVHQGTVFAALLLPICICDIDKNTGHSFMSSFADDTKVSMKIATEEENEKQHADINQLFDWATEDNIMINSDKFQVLRYGVNEEAYPLAAMGQMASTTTKCQKN